MPELCCVHCDCCLKAWDGDHCRACGADCYECPLRLEMIDAQRIAQDRIPFLWRLALAALAAAAVAALVDWLFYGGI